MRTVRFFVPLLSLLLIAGCSTPRFDSASEGQKLLQRDREWAQVASEGKDVDKVVSYWTDDAKLFDSGQPVLEGKAALRAYVAESFKLPGFKIHWLSKDPVFSPDGKMAYLQETAEITVPGPDGAPVTLHSRGVTIWRVDPDGQWRCVIDIGNAPPHS
jgi:ketosteroid isomerase-like protein